MTQIKGSIFDKDGTLFDFGATWETWASAFLLRLCDGDTERAFEIGKALEFDMRTQTFSKTSVVIAATPPDIAHSLAPFFPHMTLTDLLDLLNEEAEQAPQREAVPLVPFLTDLRARGLRLGVATNDAEKPARAHLEQASATGFFDFIAGYDSGFGGKPGPGQLMAFADRYQLQTDQCVMVGDSTHDLRAGRAAGMQTFGVLPGMAEAEVLRPFADVVRPDIGHLPDWLDGQEGPSHEP